jgi:pseudouridine synthase
MARERLQKLIATAGLCSRRRGEDLLRQGRVSLNGQVARLGDRADPDVDHVTVDGHAIGAHRNRLTLLLNKPAGVISTCHDPQGRTTVLDLLPGTLRHGTGLHPVGRLDADSRGALLLTNNGELTLRLTHPRFGHTKTYRVWVRGHPDPSTLERWRSGPLLDGRRCRPARIQLLRRGGDATLLSIQLREGRKRQIRRCGELFEHPVLDLRRVAIGGVSLADLPEGRWRELAPEEWEPLVRSP